MAITGLVKISLQEIYSMPVGQRLKYLELCKDYNKLKEKATTAKK